MVSLRKMKMKSVRAFSFKRRGKKNNKMDDAGDKVTEEWRDQSTLMQAEEWSDQSTPTKEVLMTEHPKDTHQAPDVSSSTWSSSSASEEEKAFDGAGERRSSSASSPAPDAQDAGAANAPQPTGRDAAAAEVCGADDDPPPAAENEPFESSRATMPADDGIFAAEVHGASDAAAQVGRVRSGPTPAVEEAPSTSGAAPTDDGTVPNRVGDADDGGPGLSVRVEEAWPSEEEAGERTRVSEGSRTPRPAASRAVVAVDEVEIVAPAHGLMFCGCFGV